MPQSNSEIDESVLEEGCYYLTRMGLTDSEVGKRFEIEPAAVMKYAKSYAAKLKSGAIVPGEFDGKFWEDVRKEAEGDVKVTFLSDKGFHHSWKSELRKLDGPTLMLAFESSKDFLNADPNQRFLDYPAPKGYDPLALEREVKKAIEVLGEVMAEKWKEESAKEADGKPA